MKYQLKLPTTLLCLVKAGQEPTTGLLTLPQLGNLTLPGSSMGWTISCMLSPAYILLAGQLNHCCLLLLGKEWKISSLLSWSTSSNKGIRMCSLLLPSCWKVGWGGMSSSWIRWSFPETFSVVILLFPSTSAGKIGFLGAYLSAPPGSSGLEVSATPYLGYREGNKETQSTQLCFVSQILQYLGSLPYPFHLSEFSYTCLLCYVQGFFSCQYIGIESQMFLGP